MRVLIINADDFGLAPAINAGIVDAFRAGCLTSTTLMVNAGATAEAAALAAENPGLGVGLHFNLTQGRPVSPADEVSSLVDGSGQLHPRGRLSLRLLTGRVSAADVGRELRAQLAAMRALGVEPTHVDSHQHVHGFPLVFDQVAGLCSELDLPMRMPWLLELPTRKAAMGRRLRQALLRRMLVRNERKWRGRVRWNSGLGSIFDVGAGTGPLDPERYREILAAAPGGVFELMVHPSRDAEAVRHLTRIGDISEREWTLLTSRALAPLIGELGFSLKNFREAFA